MAVHLHDYGPDGVGAGGAPINYAQVAQLLRTTPALEARTHDFFSLIDAGSGAALLKRMAPGDTLVCTAGPYANLYHYWREQSGMDFRIIRDARTTAWTPYLTQEWLVGPLVRPDDAIIFPSLFAREFYLQRFRHISTANSRVLYPLADHLPKDVPRLPGKRLRIGFLGRISDDKNVLNALKLLVALRRTRPAELHVAGAFFPPGRQVFSRETLRRAATDLGLPLDTVIYHGYLPYAGIWAFLASTDVLYFPAVSSIESFGRVLVEAGRAGVPVVASDFAAAPELLPAANLVPVHFKEFFQEPVSRAFLLGEADLEHAARIVLNGPETRDFSSAPRYSAAAFLALIDGRDSPAPETFASSPTVHWILETLRIDGLDPLSKTEAMRRNATQLRFLRSLYSRRLLKRLDAVRSLVRYLHADPLLRIVARERLFNLRPTGVLRNVLAAARAVGFDPRLTLKLKSPRP